MSGFPEAGDTDIVPFGTVVAPTDAQLTANTIETGGTTSAAAFIVTGDSLITEANPTFNSATLFDMSVPGQTTAEQVLLDTVGTFVNQGTIEANGLSGSSFTIDVQQGTSGAAGSFANYGIVGINVGDTMTVVVGTNATFSDLGSIQVSGGTLSMSGSGLALGGSPTAPQQNGATLSATSGGRVEAKAGLEVWSGSTVSVDSTSAVDIGSSGSFDAGAIIVESGETLLGDGVVAASVVDDGVVEATNLIASGQPAPGTLEITGALTGTGTVNMDRSAILQLDGSVAATQILNFATGGSELILKNPPGTLTAAIDNLNTGDRIEFGGGVVVTGASVTAPGTVTVTTNTGSIVLSNVSFAAANQSFYWYQDSATGDWAIQVAPAFLNWTGAISTDLGTAGNWSPPGPPNSSDAIGFSNGGGTLTGSASALGFNISGSGTFDFNGATLTIAGQPSPPYLPYAGGFSADTVLDATTFNAAGGTTNISGSGGVTVTAEGGSTVTTLGETVGVNSGESGSLVLTGAMTSWTVQRNTSLEANGFQSGYLTIGQNSGSTGTISVSSGASLTAQNGLDVGVNGSGALTVSAATVTSTADFVAGNLAGGSGTVTIEGGGTIATGGAYNAIGAGGIGALVIDGGGTFVSTSAPLSGNYVLYIGDQAPSGTLLGGSGYVLVDGGLLDLNNNGSSDNGLALGLDGGSGILNMPRQKNLWATFGSGNLPSA